MGEVVQLIAHLRDEETEACVNGIHAGPVLPGQTF